MTETIPHINKITTAFPQGRLRTIQMYFEGCISNGDSPLTLVDKQGRTLLHLSVHLKSYPLVEFLIKEGVDINQGDKDNVTALHRACRNGSVDIVKLLLNNPVCLNPLANGSITPLHVAANNGHWECVDLILNRMISVFETEPCPTDVHRQTPLHYAAAEGHARTIQAILEHAGNVDAENIVGNRALHFAAASGNVNACEILTSRGANLDPTNFEGQTPLHMAARAGSSQCALHLLKLGADPNKIDRDGNTSAHLAIKCGHQDVVRVLMVDTRTDSSICDGENNSVIHVALKLGHDNLIACMLPRARDLTIRDSNGCSVIIEAIKNQSEDLALQMLKACPSLVHTATDDSVTPLHLAAERGMTNLTKELLVAGAQVKALDASGLTPSLYCAKNDSVLECLSMIENIMMIRDEEDDDNDHGDDLKQHVETNSSNVCSKISS